MLRPELEGVIDLAPILHVGVQAEALGRPGLQAVALPLPWPGKVYRSRALGGRNRWHRSLGQGERGHGRKQDEYQHKRDQ